MPVILCFTVLASVSFGVVAAYAVVIAILQAFAASRSAQAEPASERPRLRLVPTQSHASGD
jgi:hypothetical protein